VGVGGRGKRLTHDYGPYTRVVPQTVFWRQAAEDLDVGCGDGELLARLAECRLDQVRVRLSSALLDIADLTHIIALATRKACMQSALYATQRIELTHLASPACTRIAAARTSRSKLAAPAILQSGTSTAASRGTRSPRGLAVCGGRSASGSSGGGRSVLRIRSSSPRVNATGGGRSAACFAGHAPAAVMLSFRSEASAERRRMNIWMWPADDEEEE
jgi:hypothetical protein